MSFIVDSVPSSLFAFLLFLLVFLAPEQGEAYPRVTTRDVAVGLNGPVDLLCAEDGDLWLLQSDGSIFRIEPQSGERKKVVTIPEVVIARGAYGMALDPQFGDSSWVYVYYPIVNDKGWTEGRIERWWYDRKSDSLVDPDILLREFFTVQWAVGGGLLALEDRTLLFGTGDGISHFADAQKHTSIAGKIFRIGLDGSTPEDNPWPGAPFPTDLLWATGFSNLSDITDGPDGLLYGTEIGNSGIADEINVLMMGRNYGWSPVRGFCDLGSERDICSDSNMVDPLYEFYRGRSGRVGPTGIAWLEKGRFGEWSRSLLVTTEDDGLWQIELREDGRGTNGIYHYLYSSDDLDAYGHLRDICVGPAGEIYVAVADLSGDPDLDRVIELTDVDFQPLSNGVAAVNSREVTDRLALPSQILWGPDSTVWVAETSGEILRIEPGSGAREILGDISGLTIAPEGGLLGMTLHPRFPDSAWIYLSYVIDDVGLLPSIRLARFGYDATSRKMSEDPEVLIGALPWGTSRRGGRLGIGPDEKIVMALGDGGREENVAERSSWGAILRIEPDGRIPEENPQAGEGFPAELIWSEGMRNPLGIVTAENNLLYSVDATRKGGELNTIMPTRDYGWPDVSGYCDREEGESEACRELDLTEPMREWLDGDLPAGLDYYGSSTIPLWHNSLLVTMRRSGEVIQMKLTPNGDLIETENRYLDGEYGELGDLCVADDGRVFVVTANGGAPGQRIDRLVEIGGEADSTLGDESVLVTRTVAEGLDTPWELVWGPDDHLWITERAGQISRIEPESGLRSELLDISDMVHEFAGSGMLGMTLHPDFETDPYLYVVYTYLANPGTSDITMFERLERYTYDPVADTLIDPFVLVDSIVATIYHDGSRVMILPDMTIMMATGDAADRSLPQDHGSLNGKILRMNLDGTAPPDNPWASAPYPANLLWSTGHRNPQGLARAPDGTIYSSEHGDDSDDELNILYRGRNYGYPDVHGYCDDTVFLRYTPEESLFCADSGVVEPIRSWTPTLGVCGLAYYDHDTIPAWKNSLLLVTLGIKKPVLPLYANALIQLKLSADGERVVEEKHYFAQEFGRLRAVCVAPDGRVFIASSNEDTRGEPRPGGDRIVEIRPRFVAPVPPPHEDPAFTVVPQPLRDLALIRFENAFGPGQIVVADVTGRIVRIEEFDGGDRFLFRRGTLPSGLYVLRVTGQLDQQERSFTVRVLAE